MKDSHFVTRKITHYVANYDGSQDQALKLGNIDATRDWGFAGDYVEAMWLCLQQEKPDDYLIATGQSHSVRQFIEWAFESIGVTIEWCGSGTDEIGIDTKTGKTVVAIDPAFFRPRESAQLVGNPVKALEVLGWSAKMTLKELIKMMVESDKRAMGVSQT
jgi:GDPmannose 4,6-dehydratase